MGRREDCPRMVVYDKLIVCERRPRLKNAEKGGSNV